MTAPGVGVSHVLTKVALMNAISKEATGAWAHHTGGNVNNRHHKNTDTDAKSITFTVACADTVPGDGIYLRSWFNCGIGFVERRRRTAADNERAYVSALAISGAHDWRPR
jgi:hypothetical protein